ncbi:MAG: 50S ribosomal protein L21e [Candidatus Aenigmatarchaeota archaeon]
MVVKSHGARKRTRDRFRGPKKLTVNRIIQNFDIGQKVAIRISSNQQKGMPFRRLNGKTGVVVEKRGRAYVVEVYDMDSKKKAIARPEHLKAA